MEDPEQGIEMRGGHLLETFQVKKYLRSLLTLRFQKCNNVCLYLV